MAGVCPELEEWPGDRVGRLGSRMSAVGKVGWELDWGWSAKDVTESGVMACS